MTSIRTSIESNNSSEATRRRLLDAALEAFGESGFDAVTTRALAAKAEVNQAAIPYHFGGKDGLYLAVVEDLVADAKDSIGTAATRIQQRLKAGPIPMDEGEALVAEIINAAVHFLVGADRARFRAAFVIREQMHPSQAFDLLYEGYMRGVHATVTALVAALLDEDPNDESSVLRAHALLGQILAFGAGRELVLRRAGWDAFTQERLDRIAQSVTETFLAAIHAMRAERMPSRGSNKRKKK